MNQAAVFWLTSQTGRLSTIPNFNLAPDSDFHSDPSLVKAIGVGVIRARVSISALRRGRRGIAVSQAVRISFLRQAREPECLYHPVPKVSIEAPQGIKAISFTHTDVGLEFHQRRDLRPGFVNPSEMWERVDKVQAVQPVLLGIGSLENLKSLGVLPLPIVVLCDHPPPPGRCRRPCKCEALFRKLPPVIPVSGIGQKATHQTEGVCIIRVDGQHAVSFNPHSLGLTGDGVGKEECEMRHRIFRCKFDSAISCLEDAWNIDTLIIVVEPSAPTVLYLQNARKDRPRFGISGIAFDSGLQTRAGPSHWLRGTLCRTCLIALKDALVGRKLGGRLCTRPLQLCLCDRTGADVADCSADMLRDVILYAEKACRCRRPLVALRPNVGTRAGIDELRGDADLIGDTPEAAFDHILRLELAAQLLHFHGLLLVGEGGVTSQHPQLIETT